MLYELASSSAECVRIFSYLVVVQKTVSNNWTFFTAKRDKKMEGWRAEKIQSNCSESCLDRVKVLKERGKCFELELSTISS